MKTYTVTKIMENTDTIRSITEITFEDFQKQVSSGNNELLKEFHPQQAGGSCFQVWLNGNRRYFNKGQKLVREKGKWEIK